MSVFKSIDPTKPRESASPKYLRSHTVYTDENYVDLHGNRWLIRISGEANAVRLMVEKGQIILDAIPVDEDSWKQAIEELQPEYRKERPDHAEMRELPSLETHALLIRPREHPYWRIYYEVVVPYAGNSWHTHTVTVGGDCLAKVTFTAARLPIRVRMEGDSASGLAGEVSWVTNRASLELGVHEDGTDYRFQGDLVTPPGG